MLLLNPKAQSVWVKHDDSGAEFKIRVMDSSAVEALEAKALKADGITLDYPLYAEHFAVAMIEDWKAVGDQGQAVACTEDHRRQLARAHHSTIVAWLIRKAKSLDHFKTEEEQAAKNA